eukprot:249964-Amphidinium_carterae.2
MNDTNEYLWFIWLTDAQYNDFKETFQCQATRRLVETMFTDITDRDNTKNGVKTPLYMLVWKTSMNNILSNSHARAAAHSSIYFRRAEDVSNEFNPVFNGQEPQPLNLRNLLGRPIGVWTMDDWYKIDTTASTILWLDHSISAWCVTETQWHLNEYSAITMLNTNSFKRSFRGFCENNGLGTMLYDHK